MIYSRVLVVLFLTFFIYGNVLAEKIVSTGNYSYSLTLNTTADKQTIWELWYDVENWKSYDTVLKYSYLEEGSDFAVGSFGYVKARGAPKTKFELVEVDLGNGFVENLKLPLWSSLDLKRRVVRLDNKTVAFTHEVEFKGRFKRVMYWLLAKRFKKDLKMVMTNMKTIAESEKLSK